MNLRSQIPLAMVHGYCVFVLHIYHSLILKLCSLFFVRSFVGRYHSAGDLRNKFHFCIDLKQRTFETLEILLSMAHSNTNEEIRSSLLMSCLSLLKLQVCYYPMKNTRLLLIYHYYYPICYFRSQSNHSPSQSNFFGPGYFALVLIKMYCRTKYLPNYKKLQIFKNLR